MIPTQHKSKLPDNLTWPIGAEAISAALAGAPHAGDFALWFSGWSAAEFQRMGYEPVPYAILVAEYRPPSKPGYSAPASLIDRGWYGVAWELKVYPVLRQMRAIASSLLRERGLPAVAEWLRASGRPGWESRHHRIEFVFAPADGTLVTRIDDGV